MAMKVSNSFDFDIDVFKEFLLTNRKRINASI